MAAVLILGAGFATWAEDRSPAPDVLVRTVVSDVLAAVARIPPVDREGRDKALAIAKQSILPHVDFERMTRLAVGRGWRAADARQRAQLVAQFSSLITRVYSAAIDNYNGHQSVVDPLQLAPGDTDVVVRSRFQKTGAPAVEVNYSMWKSPQGWKVYDINVENVSLIITYRSQFSEEVARSGIEGLIAKLAEKNRNAAP